MGNGKIDEVTIQETGNCWACAGLISLAGTPEGKAFLENNIKRDNKRHLTAVHLQGAENAGLPKPNGDGIYTFSDVEILKGQDEYAYGDGDITAYNLAIAQYRQDSSKHPLAKNRENYLDGGSIQEAYEILTGLPSNENSGTIGVSSVSLDFDEIYNMIKDGKGAACLSDEDHAYSVVGTDKDGNLLLQESI